LFRYQVRVQAAPFEREGIDDVKKRAETEKTDLLPGQTPLPGMPEPPPIHLLPTWEVTLTVKAKRLASGQLHDPEAISGGEGVLPDTFLYEETVTRKVAEQVLAASREEAMEEGRRLTHARVGGIEDLFADYGPHLVIEHSWKAREK
jgi:hypothetical protein